VSSEAQNCLVDVFDALVSLGKTIARVVDLLLGEILDHEEVLNGIARLAQLAVSCDHIRAVDHETRLPPTRCGVVCDRVAPRPRRVGEGRMLRLSPAGRLGLRLYGRK
jgi:hypothetical protein